MCTSRACSVCPILNACSVCSSQGLRRVGSPHVSKTKTIDPLRCVRETTIMTSTILATQALEEISGGNMTTQSAYSRTQVDKSAYNTTYARVLTHMLTTRGEDESGQRSLHDDREKIPTHHAPRVKTLVH